MYCNPTIGDRIIVGLCLRDTKNIVIMLLYNTREDS